MATSMSRWTGATRRGQNRREAEMSPTRRDLEESWAWLRQHGFNPPMNSLGKAYLPARPLVEELPFAGLTIRGLHEEVSFDHLTMPRTLFDSANFHGVSFVDTDLKLSLFLNCQVI